jgi:hypothetical protein
MSAPSESDRLQLLARVGLILVSVALVLTLFGAVLASGPKVAAIDSQKLDNYQASLQSYAQESLAVAYQYQHKRALANYTAVSTEKLYQAVSELTTQLQTAQTSSGLKADVDETAEQANDLADVLSDFSKTASQGTAADYTEQLTNQVQKIGEL